MSRKDKFYNYSSYRLCVSFTIIVLSFIVLSSCVPKVDFSSVGISPHIVGSCEKTKTILDNNSHALQQYQQENDTFNDGHRPYWGLALSGGGVRSASFSIGVMKALYDIKILDKIDVISSVSGGSYASLWYFAQHYAALSNEKLNSDRVNSVIFADQNFQYYICCLQNYANMFPNKIIAIALLRLSKDWAFEKYKSSIQRTFHKDYKYTKEVSDFCLYELKDFIVKKNLPYFIINATIRSNSEKMLNTVFEFTPINLGSNGLGFYNFCGGDYK